MSAQTCTLPATLVGIPWGDCGRDATQHITALCANGHTRERDVCDEHAAMLHHGQSVVCEQCAGAGDDTVPLTVQRTVLVGGAR